jgi:hypothetical protein
MAGGTDPAVDPDPLPLVGDEVAADMEPMEPPPPQALKAASAAKRVKDLRIKSSLNACGRSYARLAQSETVAVWSLLNWPNAKQNP